MSLVCVDVDYRASRVVTAALAFDAWESDTASHEVASCSDAAPAGYVPGSFYEREMPYVLAGLADLARVAELSGLTPVAEPASAADALSGARAARAILPVRVILPVRAILPARVILIDGYVWLGAGRPGLGAHLYQALSQRTAVVGVAKRRFHGAGDALPILRGTSQAPLFVTAVGIDLAEAAANVQRMHGPHRIPTLLKRVDRLSRDAHPAHARADA